MVDELPNQLSLVEARASELSAAPFFPAIEEEVERGEITHKRYTAERLFQQKPEKFQAVVHWLAQGLGLLRIGKLVGVHHMTVAAVRDLYPAAVDIEKARLAGLCKTAAELCIERIIEEAPSMPANTLGLTAAQMIDKFQLLTGGATSRIEDGRKPGVPTHDEFAKMLEGLPEANARVIEPGMGLGREDLGANGGSGSGLDAGSDAGLGGSERAVGAVDQGAAGAGSDPQSLGCPTVDAIATADATALGAADGLAEPVADRADGAPRGGGGSVSEMPPDEGLGQNAAKF